MLSPTSKNKSEYFSVEDEYSIYLTNNYSLSVKTDIMMIEGHWLLYKFQWYVEAALGFPQ